MLEVKILQSNLEIERGGVGREVRGEGRRYLWYERGGMVILPVKLGIIYWFDDHIES